MTAEAHGLTVITARRFDPAAAEITHRPAGATIAEMVAEGLPGATPDQLSRTVVIIVSAKGEWEVYAEYWRLVRPTAGMTVRIHVRLMGRDILRLILSVAVFAAASFLGPLVFGAGLAGALGTAAFGALGTLALNALIPIQKPKTPPTPEERYSISGARNEARPYGKIPEIHGKRRFFPPWAALPFTETVGEDRYARFLMNLGYADTVFTEWKIGETPIEEFRDVELQIYKLSPGDPWPVDGYPNPVFETEETISLKQTDGWQTRRTARNVDYISIEILFAKGCGYVDKKGNVDAQTYEFEIRRRRVFDDGRPDGDYKTVISPLSVFEGTTTPFRVTHAWLEDEPGQWDVGIRRLSLDGSDIMGALEKTDWVVLRGVRPVRPVTFNRPIHLAYARLRATGQAQGVLDRFNCMASSIRPDFDVASGTWVTRETQSPAAHARRILQGPANAFPVPDDELKLSDFEEMARFAKAKGLHCNVIHDDDRTVESALKQVMRGARAFPTRHNGLRGCFIDRPQEIVRGHIASVNATNFSGEPVYEEPVDALKVSFDDETNGYTRTERIVPRRGLVGKPKTFEEVDFGVYTSPKLNWIEAMRLHLEYEFRWERLFAEQDAEHLFSPPGSLVLAHFLTVRQRQVSGRVVSVDGNLVVLSQDVVMDADAGYACVFRSKAGRSFTRAVRTVAGEPTNLLSLTGNGFAPEAGNLFMFGPAGSEAEEMIIRGVEPQKMLRARLTMVPHAPQIEALAEAEPPNWFPIDPVPRTWQDKKPAVPVISSIVTVSPTPNDNGAPEEKGVIVLVRVQEGPGGKAPTDTILITIEGVDEPETPADEQPKPPAETERSVTAGIGRAEFHHHTVGDAVTVRAQAFSIFGEFSAVSAAKAYTVKRPNNPPADVTFLSVTRQSDGMRRYRFELDPDATGAQRKDVAGYRIYARPGAGWRFEDLAPLVGGTIANSPFESRRPITTGPHVFAAVAVDAAGDESAKPFFASKTLGASNGPAIILQRLETSSGWNGLIDQGQLSNGALVGDRIVYRTPILDLGQDRAADVSADLYGLNGTAKAEMRIGLASAGTPTGNWRPLEDVTARYLQIRVTAKNGDFPARIADLVTVVTPS